MKKIIYTALLFPLFVALAAFSDSSTNKNHEINDTEEWRFWTSEDDFTGEKRAFASSPAIKSVSPMRPPYNETTASFVIGCDGESEWSYLAFSNDPNLLNTDIRDGFHAITANVRWDNEATRLFLTQTFGSRFLHFTYATQHRLKEVVIDKAMSANNFSIQLNWYMNDNVVFRIPLNGSSNAINQMRNACSSF